MATSGEPATLSKVFKIEYSHAKGVLGVGKGIMSSVISVGGHDWRVEYYPDGYNHMNADWICLRLRGSACENVEARFGFSLLDQMGEPVPAYTAASGTCTFSSMAPSWGFERFIRRSVLETSTYLGDDGSFSVSFWVTVLKPTAAAVAYLSNRSKIQPRKVEQEEEEKGRMSKVDHEMMKTHMSELVARSLR